MRRLALPLVVTAIMLAGCSAADDPDPTEVGTTQPDAGATESAAEGSDTPADAELEARTFVAGEAIPVTLSMISSDDGGRRTAYFAGYRPDVAFEGADAVTCAFGVPEGAGEFAPGDTGDLDITCTEDVTIEPDILGFTVIEGGREVGTGEVRLTAAK